MGITKVELPNSGLFIRLLHAEIFAEIVTRGHIEIY
jgi:hypothetical protein